MSQRDGLPAWNSIETQPVVAHMSRTVRWLSREAPLIECTGQRGFGRVAGRANVMGLVLHGDAAFAGQGVVAETLQLANLPGARFVSTSLKKPQGDCLSFPFLATEYKFGTHASISPFLQQWLLPAC